MTGRPVTVVGGGAIGGITAAYLARAGRDVTVVDPWREHTLAMDRGLRVTGVRGEFVAPVRAIDPEELHGPLDIVLLAVKSANTLHALHRVMPMMRENSALVSLQNAINEELIASEIGRRRTIGCVTGWGAVVVAPGHLEQTCRGEFVIGGLDGETDGLVAEVRDILADVTETSTTSNIHGFLWLKLITSGAAAVGALWGRPLEETLAFPEAVPAIRAIIAEGLEVAARLGLTLQTTRMTLAPDQYSAARDYVVEVVMAYLAGEYAGILPPVHQDILRGHRPETDFINGYIARKGREVGVPTPVNEGLVLMVRELEEGTRAIGAENIRELSRVAAAA